MDHETVVRTGIARLNCGLQLKPRRHAFGGVPAREAFGYKILQEESPRIILMAEWPMKVTFSNPFIYVTEGGIVIDQCPIIHDNPVAGRKRIMDMIARWSPGGSEYMLR